MYKIVFNPTSCMWEIKLQFLAFFWRTLKGKAFQNYLSAEDYVSAVGLDQVYRRYDKSWLAWVMAGGVE